MSHSQPSSRTSANDSNGTLRSFAVEFIWFGIKQAQACIFGALLLFGIIVTRLWYPDIGINRYDFLFIYAVIIQVGLILFKLESIRECGVVIVFHILATAMELFKTSDSINSWSYPEEAVIKFGNVPLFAGFMYSAVGSYLARVWRIFHFRFDHFPPLWIAAGLAILSYVNFFTHHFVLDIRMALLVAIGIFYLRTNVYYKPYVKNRRMNLLLGYALVAFFIWIAENLGTVARAWVYPNQKDGWTFVGFDKITSWFLLMQLSFVLIYSLRMLERRLKESGRLK